MVMDLNTISVSGFSMWMGSCVEDRGQSKWLLIVHTKEFINGLVYRTKAYLWQANQNNMASFPGFILSG